MYIELLSFVQSDSLIKRLTEVFAKVYTCIVRDQSWHSKDAFC